MALAASWTSLGNGFAYDDLHLVAHNERVHSLTDLPRRFLESYWPEVPMGPSGRLYRPLTVAGFSLQWAAVGGQPLAFHLVSVGLYALVCLMVFALARRFTGPVLATAAAALFAAHPVHVEAVANVVGQGELLAAALLLPAAVVYADGRRRGFPPARTGLLLALYLAACLAKEHAVVLPVLLLALEPAIRPRTGTREEAGKVLLSLVLVGVLYLAARSAVLGGGSGDLAHPAWRGLPVTQRVWTMLALVPRGLTLLLWPAHLQADYSPREVVIAVGPGTPQLVGGLILAVLVGLALLGLRARPLVTAGLGWAAVALLPASNLLTPTGVVLAERTLFLASLGIMLALAGGLEALAAASLGRPVPGRVAAAAVMALVALGVGQSAARGPVWRDNTTLFRQTVEDAPASYWAWRNWGGDLVRRDRLPEALAAYRRSVALFDRDPQVYDELAGINRRLGRCDRAVPWLQRSLALDPARHQTAARLIGCLVAVGDFETARAVARERMAAGRDEFRGLLELVDSAAGSRR